MRCTLRVGLLVEGLRLRSFFSELILKPSAQKIQKEQEKVQMTTYITCSGRLGVPYIVCYDA